MSKELKPCPFCGHEAEMLNYSENEWLVHCTACDGMVERWREFDEEEADTFANSVTRSENAQIAEVITEYLINNKDFVISMIKDNDKEMLQDEILQELKR